MKINEIELRKGYYDNVLIILIYWVLLSYYDFEKEVNYVFV